MARAQAYEDSIAQAKAKALQQRLSKEMARQQLRDMNGGNTPVQQTNTVATSKESITIQPSVADGIAHDYTVTTEVIKPDYTTMPAILFEKNTAAISLNSKSALKVLAQTLMKNPAMVVNLYAFASVDENNAREVSLQRSDAVLRYLIVNGAGIEQVKSFYNGGNDSRNGCNNPNCPEGLLLQNRAVAYQLVQ